MIILLVKYILRFITLVLIQVLVVNKLNIGTFINPYIYFIFILTLPFNTKPWVVLLISLFSGIIMDSFSAIPGPHIAATVFIGYFRRFYIEFSTNADVVESNEEIGFKNKGVLGFIVYVVILVFLHHLLLFFLEAFTFNQFFSTIERIIFSTFFTSLIMVVQQLLFYRLEKE
jgi:hypothetical protein